MKISKKLSLFLQLDKTNAVANRRFASRGISFGDIAVLLALQNSPEERLRRIDLAEQMGLTASGVTRMLVPMEKIGLIKREVNARDARVSYAMITTSGKRVLKESLELAEEVCDEMIPKEQGKKIDEVLEVLKGIG